MTLRELAELAVTDPGRMASLLVPYARARGWDDASLAEALQCPLDSLPRVLVARNPFLDRDGPGSGRWWQDLAGVTALWGGSARKLDTVLRAARAHQENHRADAA